MLGLILEVGERRPKITPAERDGDAQIGPLGCRVAGKPQNAPSEESSTGHGEAEGKDRAAEAARQGREIVNKQRENLTTAFDRARDQFQSRETGQDA